jgi:hypothetical protein
MKQMQERTERAVTVLELIILVLVMVAAGYLIFVLASEPHTAGSGGGYTGILTVIPDETGKNLHVVGVTTVFAATDNNPSNVQARYPVPDPSRMGSLEAGVSLFIGDSGSVDFDKINLVWLANGSTERIPRKDSRPLVCPGWTIAGKYNVVPMKSANDNDLLEPGEQFLIFVCPASPVPAYQSFTVGIEDSGGYQSPFLGGIAPVMNSRIGSLM